MKSAARAETETSKRQDTKALKPPHHYDGPWYWGPQRNPLIPAALCAPDSFMSPVREMVNHEGGKF